MVSEGESSKIHFFKFYTHTFSLDYPFSNTMDSIIFYTHDSNISISRLDLFPKLHHQIANHTEG